MRELRFILPIFLLLSVAAYGQAYNQYSYNMFFMQQPNARAEAMGRGNAALTGDSYGMFYNPAATAFNQGAALTYSDLSPNNMFADDLHYKQFGASYNSGKYGALGFSYMDFSWGTTRTTVTNPDGNGFEAYTDIYIGNYSYMVWDNLSAGFNITYFNDKLDASANCDAALVDIGFLKKFPLSDKMFKQDAYIALSASNIFNAAVKVNAIYGEIEEYLPSIFRLAGAYEIAYNPEDAQFIPLALTACAEYQDVLNYGYYTKVQLGGELTVFEMLKIRAGYYTFNNDNYGDDYYADRISEATYGFGIALPFHKFFENIPVVLSADYTKLPSPVYNENFRDQYKDYEVFSMNLNVEF